jgi:mRNA interferase MazF
VIRLPERGQVRWADLGEPRGSEPGHRRPVVVISADSFNTSRIRTVVVAAITTSERARRAPGNVPLHAGQAGLDRDCAVNVSQLLTLDKDLLERSIGALGERELEQLDEGLRLVLDLR